MVFDREEDHLAPANEVEEEILEIPDGVKVLGEILSEDGAESLTDHNGGRWF